MKKSEKQEQNQGEVEDEGADRKYQVFNFFWNESIRSSKLVLMLTRFFLSYIWCTRDWYMYQVTFCYNLPFCVLYIL